MGQDLGSGLSGPRLQRLIDGLLALHRALIDVAKRDYERSKGPVANPYALFSLLTSEPSFRWLQPMTRFIVEAEELRDRKGAPPGPAEVDALASRARSLLSTEEAGFAAKLEIALETHQASGAAHQSLMKLL
jgi:hypothetical protein